MTSHNLPAKVPKGLDIFHAKCELIFEPTLSPIIFNKILLFALAYQ